MCLSCPTPRLDPFRFRTPYTLYRRLRKDCEFTILSSVGQLTELRWFSSGPGPWTKHEHALCFVFPNVNLIQNLGVGDAEFERFIGSVQLSKPARE